MIPDFDPGSGNLPPGLHPASWDEFVARFGTTAWRRGLLEGLRQAADALRAVGCRTLYVDGSFVTSKVRPGDFDGCWATEGVDLDALAARTPVLLDFRNSRAAQKATYGGELFLADANADPWGTLFLDFFQRDRSGDAKGIVVIDLTRLT